MAVSLSTVAMIKCPCGATITDGIETFTFRFTNDRECAWASAYCAKCENYPKHDFVTHDR